MIIYPSLVVKEISSPFKQIAVSFLLAAFVLVSIVLKLVQESSTRVKAVKQAHSALTRQALEYEYD